MRGPGRRRPQAVIGDLGGTALLGFVIGALLASSVAFVATARTIDLGPKVGDILVFRPGHRMTSDWEFTVAAPTRQPVASCVLKPDVMTSGGGSLVVERQLAAPRTYQVHWAGLRTSDGVADCGHNMELVVSGPDLQLLTNAVGGAGVERKSFPGF